MIFVVVQWPSMSMQAESVWWLLRSSFTEQMLNQDRNTKTKEGRTSLRLDAVFVSFTSREVVVPLIGL